MAIIERALQWLGVRAPVAQPTSVPTGRHIQDLALWDQFKRIGGALTPIQVSGIIREADGGRMQRLVDLANDARQKDGHLQSVLGTREKAVAGLDWQLFFPRQKPGSTRGNRQMRFVEEALLEHPSLNDTIEHLIGSVYYGRTVTEIVWENVEGKLVPGDLVNHSPRRFGFRPSDGAFVWADNGNPESGTPLLEISPWKFVIAAPRITGDVPCREGLVRVLMWAALFRNWALSDWLKLGEIAWKPWRRGVYKKGASKEDRAALEEILEGMSASGTATYPETVDVHIDWPGGAVSQKATHSELFDKVGAEMSKAVLGQTLTTEQGKVGTQALGKVHDEVRGDILEADAKFLGSVITRYLIVPLVRLNFGPTAPVPHLRFITEETADIASFGDGVGKLRQAGLRIPAQWVRAQVGMPEPEEDDELLGDMDEVEEEDDGDEIEDEAADETPADDADAAT